MTTITKNRKKIMLVFLLVLISTPCIPAQETDNAALLYYQACSLFEHPKQDVFRPLHDLVEGRIEPAQNVKEYVESQHYVIGLVRKAAELPKCHWGLNYPAGVSMQLPHLGTYKALAKTIIADARVLAFRQEYKKALERCITAHKMAGQVGNDMIIGTLVAASITKMANECIRDILGEMPLDIQTLKGLKMQLIQVEKATFSLKAGIETDAKATAKDFTQNRVEKMLSLIFGAPIVALSPDEDTGKNADKRNEPQKPNKTQDCQKLVRERIRNADKHFFQKNKAYWLRINNQAIATLDLPYKQAYKRLSELGAKPAKDAPTNPDATLACVLVAAFDRVYGRIAAIRNSSNSIRAAVEVYIVRARTKKLPEILPASAPKDLFSGKSLEYIKKDNGFILRSRAEDLIKEKIHEYEFKVRN